MLNSSSSSSPRPLLGALMYHIWLNVDVIPLPVFGAVARLDGAELHAEPKLQHFLGHTHAHTHHGLVLCLSAVPSDPLRGGKQIRAIYLIPWRLCRSRPEAPDLSRRQRRKINK